MKNDDHIFILKRKKNINLTNILNSRKEDNTISKFIFTSLSSPKSISNNILKKDYLTKSIDLKDFDFFPPKQNNQELNKTPLYKFPSIKSTHSFFKSKCKMPNQSRNQSPNEKEIRKKNSSNQISPNEYFPKINHIEENECYEKSLLINKAPLNIKTINNKSESKEKISSRRSKFSQTPLNQNIVSEILTKTYIHNLIKIKERNVISQHLYQMNSIEKNKIQLKDPSISFNINNNFQNAFNSESPVTKFHPNNLQKWKKIPQTSLLRSTKNISKCLREIQQKVLKRRIPNRKFYQFIPSPINFSGLIIGRAHV